MERESLNVSAAVAESEVVVEHVLTVPPENRGRKGVVQTVDQFRVVERRAIRAAASPSKNVAFSPIVVVDLRELAALKRGRSVRRWIEFCELPEAEILSKGDTKITFSTVPITAEDVMLRLDDVQCAIRVELRIGVEGFPGQRFFLGHGGGRGKEEHKQSRTQFEHE